MRLRYGPRAQMVTLVGLGFAVWAAFQGKDPKRPLDTWLAPWFRRSWPASTSYCPVSRSRTNTPSPFANSRHQQGTGWRMVCMELAGERKQDGHSSGLNAPTVRRAEYDLPWNTLDKGTPAPQPQPTPSGSLRLVEATTIRGHQMRLDAVMANPTPAERDSIRYGDAVAQSPSIQL